jgi:hypothetical protein
VNNLTLKNVEISFEKKGVEPRPCIVASDVNGLVLDGFRTETTPGVKPLAFTRVERLVIRNSPQFSYVATPSP